MKRHTFVEINLDNFDYNLAYLQNKTNKKMIAVLKANGYGSNDVILAKRAIENGIDFFAVSSIEEALKLRINGIDKEILILGYVEPEDLKLIKEKKLSIVTVSKEYIQNNLPQLKGVKIHLKLNTGMNRIGISPNEANEILNELLKVKAKVEGIMTHYVSSDDNDELTQKQYEIFKQTYESLNYTFKYVHTSNTDAAVSFNDEVSNYCRCGLGLLGYSNRPNDLKPIFSLFSQVSNVKQVPKGEKVSYGGHYISDGKGYVLTLPIGYADGFTRNNTKNKVFVENEYGTIIGSICMDQMMVKTKKYHPVGSVVELFGDHISLVERSTKLKTIPYELMCLIGDRVTRVFVSNGLMVEEENIRFKKTRKA